MENLFTNQADISVSRPEDIHLPDPPCLRNISFRAVEAQNRVKLNIHVFFRSWDLYAASAMNLYAMARLLEYVGGFLEDVKVGKIYAYSSGAHIYSNSLELVRKVLRAPYNAIPF